MAVIDLDLLDSFSMVENTLNPSELITLEAYDAQKIIFEAMDGQQRGADPQRGVAIIM